MIQLLLLVTTIAGFINKMYNTHYRINNKLFLKYVGHREDMDDYDKFEYYSTQNNKFMQKEYLYKIHKSMKKQHEKNLFTWKKYHELWNDINNNINKTNDCIEDANDSVNHYKDIYNKYNGINFWLD